jgi:hypothetical protein
MESQQWNCYAKECGAMSEIDMDRINAEIEGEIRKNAGSIELANDETVMRVTIPAAVVLEQGFR